MTPMLITLDQLHTPPAHYDKRLEDLGVPDTYVARMAQAIYDGNELSVWTAEEVELLRTQKVQLYEFEMFALYLIFRTPGMRESLTQKAMVPLDTLVGNIRRLLSSISFKARERYEADPSCAFTYKATGLMPIGSLQCRFERKTEYDKLHLSGFALALFECAIHLEAFHAIWTLPVTLYVDTSPERVEDVWNAAHGCLDLATLSLENVPIKPVIEAYLKRLHSRCVFAHRNDMFFREDDEATFYTYALEGEQWSLNNLKTHREDIPPSLYDQLLRYQTDFIRYLTSRYAPEELNVNDNDNENEYEDDNEAEDQSPIITQHSPIKSSSPNSDYLCYILVDKDKIRTNDEIEAQLREAARKGGRAFAESLMQNHKYSYLDFQGDNAKQVLEAASKHFTFIQFGYKTFVRYFKL